MPAEYVPTADQRALVENAAAFGLTQADIAQQLKVDEKTLRKHFRDELSSGKFKVDPDLARLGQRLATDINDGALSDYKTLVLIANSMGGLVVQKALVDSDELRVDAHRPLFDQQFARLVQHQRHLLLGALDRNEAHSGARHRFAAGIGVDRVVLPRLTWGFV
jgi:AraC-like DNA-binding protein